jgi:hypothetical protein
MLPYPGATFPDLAPGVMTLPNFLAATLPRRWRNLLAHKTAAHLYGADNNAAAAGVQFGLANAALGAELMRLPPVPAWRGCHMPLPKRRHYGSPVMWF